MEFDFERINANKFYSTSPTSLSSSSASSNSSLHAREAMMNQNKLMGRSELANNKSTTNQLTSSAAMSSSTSQIFLTAASFNICQNDTVYYSRETIHLLAKFLSLNSESPIFRSLYAFAPDNLAWLWAFFDWETPVDLATIPCQEAFSPFKAAENIDINDAQLDEINKLFQDAPLVQYKYREPIMIGDVYKFIEFVSKIEQSVVAKALFLLYFPRFSNYMENPLKEFIQVKVLKSNVNLIKRVDDTIISLIKSRYSNIDDYKQKIMQGQGLPSYIRSLLKENNYWNNKPAIGEDSTKIVQTQVEQTPTKAFYSPVFADTMHNSQADQTSESNVTLEQANELIANLSLNDYANTACGNQKDKQAPVFFPSFTKTIDYMKLLEKSNKINDDLDHISFDSKKALLSNKILMSEEEQQQAYDVNNNNLLMNLSDNFQFDSFHQTNADVQVDPQDAQIATKYLELICNSQSPANMKLAQQILPQLTLPQLSHLNTLTESLTNATSSALNSPKADQGNGNSSYYSQFSRKDKNPNNNMSKLNYSRLASSSQNCSPNTSCMSPISPKHNAKMLFPTPKTPSNLNQYQEKMSSDYSVWPNSTTPNHHKLTLPVTNGLNNSTRYYGDANSVTPPPSATFRTSPLSIATNGSVLDVSIGPSGDGLLNSPSCGEPLTPNSLFNKNQFNSTMSKLTDPLTVNPSLMQEDMLNSYLKHQFYGSPVTRLNKLNDFSARNNANKLLKSAGGDFSYSNLKTTRFNSNTELNQSNGNLFFRNDLVFDEFVSSKSPSSTTSSGPHTHSVANNSGRMSQQHTWSGRLPPKSYSENGVYSRKVFLGGLPWDVNQHYLIQLLQKYGSVKLEIPGKDSKHPRVSNICKSQERSTPGYVYIIYEHESAVQRMLADCRKEVKNGGEHYFYTIFIPSSNSNNANNNANYYFNNNMNGGGNKRGKAKEVEVIPWNQEDTSYVPQNKTSMLPAKIDAKSTIFVGALHGMLNAQGLAKVMNEIFGEVIHAGLDTDKYKYPIGSGRVTFRNRQSYVKAIKSKFVTIKANLDATDPSPKFEKTIQIDPYLEDAKCFKCNNRSFFFCRNEHCLDYYCENCWKTNHDMIGNGEHQSLSRQNKPNHG